MMQELLEQILTKAEEEDHPAAVTVALGGQVMMGILERNQEIEGLYILKTQVQQGSEIGIGYWTFAPDRIALMAFQPMDQPKLFVPGGQRSPGGIVQG